MKQLSPLTTLLILFGCFGIFVLVAVLYYRDRMPNRFASTARTSGKTEIETTTEEEAASELSSGHERTGSEACGKCHPGILASYKKHPMYYGATKMVQNDPVVPTDSGPIQGKIKTLLANTREGRMYHTELATDLEGDQIYSKQREMKYVVGSGRRAKAYVEERGNMLCLSPLNWFGKTSTWGLNPGYSVDDPRGFDRKALANCLLCHTGEIRTESPMSDFYQSEPFGELAIGCERCHGAGKSHVEFHELGVQGSDPIVNPESLEESARQAVCYQCHLQPSTARILREGRSHQDFQPGMRLDDVWLVLDTESGVDSEGRTKSVRHVQQMHDSLCFKRSHSMRCSSCHDPHSVPEPAEQIEFYRDACNRCHTRTNETQGASICTEAMERRLQVQDSCYECHMPKRDLDLSSHASQTDHRILRKPEQATTAASISNGDLKFFGEVSRSISEDALRRAVAIYLARNQSVTPALYRELKYLVKQFPNDGMTLLSFGLAAMTQNQIREAIDSWTKATEHPESAEFALEALIQIAQRSSDWNMAIRLATQLTQLNPSHANAHAQLGQALLNKGSLPEAIRSATKSIELDPLTSLGHQVLIEACRAQGLDEQADHWQASLDRISMKLNSAR
ncbi:multiheme c-type cytochrome [Pirellulaceae bacterium SH449]